MGARSTKIVSESVKKFVDAEISSHKVVVFSATYCPYCTKAKDVFKQYTIPDIQIIELNKRSDYDFDEVMTYLAELTGAQTVPRVYIDRKFIGGGDDTVKKHKTGELKSLLLACNAITE